ncbi:hypothetical protein F5884DRAFT_754937 [Xylogone sp. PMI_703]|nr:hypothetical protein F5884DRAFT_754937 [Xylogone sp. PMI_703]
MVMSNGTAQPKIYPDFKTVEASRPKWRENVPFTTTQTRNPTWAWGDGATDKDGLDKQHILINPQSDSRTVIDNYKLLISGIIPRPIAFVSTLSKDGEKSNLAPLSYFQVVNHDPPVFVLGFAGGTEKMKDTLRNLLESKECVINMISEHFLEAANAASVNAPYGTSEWALTGLTPAKCESVKASRVGESIFSVEAVFMNLMEFESKKNPGKKQGAMVVVEGVNFWVREDALNDKGTIDPDVLRPVSRLGGMRYGRLTESLEILRPVFEKDLEQDDLERLLSAKADSRRAS